MTRKGHFTWWLLICGCAAPPQTPQTSKPTSAGRTVLTLVRTQCDGICPQYRVAVDDEGNVHFDGVSHVASMGRREWHVEPHVVVGLVSRMRELCADGTCITALGCAAIGAPQAGVQLMLPNGTWQRFVTCSVPESSSDARERERIAFETEIDGALHATNHVVAR